MVDFVKMAICLSGREKRAKYHRSLQFVLYVGRKFFSEFYLFGVSSMLDRWLWSEGYVGFLRGLNYRHRGFRFSERITAESIYFSKS